LAGQGKARRGTAGEAWLGAAGCGKARQGEARQARHGEAWRGVARRGEAWRGKAGEFLFVVFLKRKLKMDVKKIEELKRIAGLSGGLLMPELVVDEARNKNNPLHEDFDWNDKSAGQSWRIEQARSLIRKVTVIVEQSENKSVRMFVSLESDRKSGGYRHINDVVSDELRLAELLATAKKELAAFEKRYKNIVELAEVFCAIKKVV